MRKASKEASNQIDNVRKSIESAKDKVDKGIKNTRETTEDVSNKTSEVSIWGFIFMVIGLIITSFGGLIGSNYTKKTIYGE